MDPLLKPREESSDRAKPAKVMLIGPTSEVLRHSLSLFLSQSLGLEVVAEVSTSAEALQLLTSLNPEVIIFSGAVPPSIDPVKFTSRMRAELNLRIPVMVMTLNFDHSYVMQALQAPVAAYLSSEETDGPTLKSVVEAVRKGLTVIGPRATSLLGSVLANSKIYAPALIGRERLTAREQEVLELMLRGLTNKEIANQLFVGVRTVQQHILHVMSKVGAHSRTEVIISALQHGDRESA